MVLYSVKVDELDLLMELLQKTDILQLNGVVVELIQAMC